MLHRLCCLFLCATLAACDVPVPAPTSAPAPRSAPNPNAPIVTPTDRVDARTARRNFAAVVRTVEPVAESFCRQRAPNLNCDFRILVDDNPNAVANAFQTVDRSGRPIIAFTLPLIADARNRDELAFVMAHEAAHHIQGHLAQTQRNASLGAALLGGIVGGDGLGQQVAQQLGASLGARTYSKEFELEADALGTRITAAAGYDPLKGAAFFTRIPDPGDRFLSTHPANADRIATVQRVAGAL